MKYLKLFLFAALTAALIYALNTKLGPAPPMGKFMDPFSGFWANAEQEAFGIDPEVKGEGLQAEATILFDERRVPHIFAENEHDAYWLQGYATASHRLWQMEFQTLVAGGRLSEKMGDNPRILRFDRKNRRFGMRLAAESVLEDLEDHPKEKGILDAYAEGVNAYINSLSYADLPLEYKLLNYTPDQWTPLHTALLLKLMSKDLAGYTADFESTNAWNYFGEEYFKDIFPTFPDTVDPIIPSGTAWDFEPVAIDTPETFEPSGQFGKLDLPEVDPLNGSNNWAVGPDKTKEGYPILCGDPHLRLTLPSIWYEIQIATPEFSVYGVSLPGSPCVIIGFNGNIAWSVTNAGRDVVDWYQIEFKDDSRNEYKYGDEWRKTTKRIEEIKIRGAETFYDTVIYTHHGPVMYDDSYEDEAQPKYVALRWAAHERSNELHTFYELNAAKNHDEYMHALSTFECPGQNFVFASKTGDVAIRQQGKFPVRWPGQGRFIMDGSNPLHDWQAFIPEDQNPHILNPERGFVSSANQHCTDSTYPYDIMSHHHYEVQRNERINRRLNEMSGITPQDLMDLQCDNYSMIAEVAVPLITKYVDVTALNGNQKQALQDIQNWNYMFNADLTAPSLFEVWSKKFYNMVWEDDFLASKWPMSDPSFEQTILLIDKDSSFKFVDDVRTPEEEVIQDVMTAAFRESVIELQAWRDSLDKPWKWADYKSTRIAHYLPTVEPFFSDPVNIGGNKHIVNATSSTHGPSWRMVVQLGPEFKAWGNYPGGQSGNPGSPNYESQITKWGNGEYNQLNYYKEATASDESIQFTQTFKP